MASQLAKLIRLNLPKDAARPLHLACADERAHGQNVVLSIIRLFHPFANCLQHVQTAIGNVKRCFLLVTRAEGVADGARALAVAHAQVQVASTDACCGIQIFIILDEMATMMLEVKRRWKMYSTGPSAVD